MYERTELDLVTGGMAAAGGHDGVFVGVKIGVGTGGAVQVDGYTGIGTRVGQGIRSAAAVQHIGACESFDDVVATVAGQDVVIGRADDVLETD